MIDLRLGDCLRIMESIPDGSVDCILTDPPYGILDHQIETQFDVADFLFIATQKLRKGGFLAYFGRQPTLTKWNNIALDTPGLKFKTEVIWYKRQRSSPMGDMGRVFENISIFSKGCKRFNKARLPYTDLKESLADITSTEGIKRIIGQLTQPYKDRTTWENAKKFLESVDRGDSSLFFTERTSKRNTEATFSFTGGCKPSGLTAVEAVVCGLHPQNLVSFMPHNKQKFDSTGEGKGEHNLKFPCVKPIQLMEWLIELMTSPGDTILDPFSGTGTTLIACQNKHRNGIGIELYDEYFNIASARIKSINQIPNVMELVNQMELFSGAF